MSRPASEAAQFKAFLFRLPPDLLDYLRDEAAASGRPLNTQVIWMLDYLRRHPVTLEAPRPRRRQPTPA